MAKLKIKNRYGIIPNELLNNSQITFKAKGLYGYLQSKPDDWDFSADRIKFDTKENRSAILSGLKELEEFGYLVRNKFQNNKGYWEIEYILYENPKSENPTQENPTKENGTTNKKRNTNKEISNKKINIINNTETSVSENSLTVSEDKRDFEVQLIIDTIKAHHGVCDGTQKEQRQYAYLLVKKIKKISGFSEKFKDVGEFLDLLIQNTDKYRIGKTTSPKKLYYNLSELIAYIRASKSKNNKNITIG